VTRALPLCAWCGESLRRRGSNDPRGTSLHQSTALPGSPQIGWHFGNDAATSCARLDPLADVVVRGDASRVADWTGDPRGADAFERVIRLVGARARARVSAGAAWWVSPPGSRKATAEVQHRATHWAGGVRYRVGREGVVYMLPGWPACCSGDRAESIRAQHAQTFDRAAVTCARCRELLAKSDAYARGET
jgi:hypothetical protein